MQPVCRQKGFENLLIGDQVSNGEKDKADLESRLISEVIIELNISRHNVSVYPKDHPIVEKSIDKAYGIFQELFHYRNKIIIALTKDSVIIDDSAFDNSHPAFKDFSNYLNSIGIATVSFAKGMSKDDLYEFHSFLSGDYSASTLVSLKEDFEKRCINNIDIEFIDYSAFDFLDDERDDNSYDKNKIWEKYVRCLLNGNLGGVQADKDISGVSPGELADVINSCEPSEIKSGGYDRVITAYVADDTDSNVHGRHLTKLLECLTELRPGIKREFLKSVINTVSVETEEIYKTLKDVPVETMQQFVSLINDEMVILPTALKNILDKFTRHSPNYKEATLFGGSLLEDDILLSPTVTGLLAETNFKAFVSKEYEKELEKILSYQGEGSNGDCLKDFAYEWNDEHIERVFHDTILEFLSSDQNDFLSEEETEFIEHLIKDHIYKFIETAQFDEVATTLETLEATSSRENFAPALKGISEHMHSPEILDLLVKSMRLSGRHRRDESIRLCRCYGSSIVPFLIDALIDEQSQSVRRYLISLIKSIGKEAMPFVLERLRDDQWYIKRNMLFILQESGGTEDLKKARPYCNHENPKVRFEALRCLLKAGDNIGIKSLRDYIKSDSNEIVRKAITLAGTYKITAVVPEITAVLRKRVFRASEFEEKIHAIRALGQIGNASAIETLEKFLETRSIFFKNPLERLKQETMLILERHKQNHASRHASNYSDKGHCDLNEDLPGAEPC